MSLPDHRTPWEEVRTALLAGDARGLEALLDRLGPAETARAISRLDPEEQERLLTLLDPAEAADVMEEVSETQAADLIEDLPPETAAAILDEMQSDAQADVLAEMSEKDAEAILRQMSPEEADDARKLLSYEPETAGGIMITEYLAYREDASVREVLRDLQARRETYAGYDVQYLYVTDPRGRLVGVVRLRDLLFAPHEAPLSAIEMREPRTVQTGTSVGKLREFFDRHHLFGVPVVDTGGRLVGVVLPEDAEEAARKGADRWFLRFHGIVGGEEFRSMPLLHRSGRRLSWCTLNIFLNLVAASVIAFYQDTLAAAIALAVFLPILSDMSGCSGNQAVAVSLRELSLGLVQPGEFLRVLWKEAGVGVLNGVALGLLLGTVAFLWSGNPWLGWVTGVALAANTVVAVALGGLLPLALRRMRLDPALVSGPVLTTVTDMCGFFLTLSLATRLLPRLAA